jgi:hypothetical protein
MPRPRIGATTDAVGAVGTEYAAAMDARFRDALARLDDAIAEVR